MSSMVPPPGPSLPPPARVAGRHGVQSRKPGSLSANEVGHLKTDWCCFGHGWDLEAGMTEYGCLAAGHMAR
jgi:hypothetical protein